MNTKQPSATHSINTAIRASLGAMNAHATLNGQASGNFNGTLITAKLTRAWVVVWFVDGEQANKAMARRAVLEFLAVAPSTNSIVQAMRLEQQARALKRRAATAEHCALH